MRKQVQSFMNIKFPWALCAMLTVATYLTAQDIHYSQYWNSPFNLNPALTGVFKGNTRFTGNYRNQWAAVPVDYMTFTGAVDHKFAKRGEGNGFFAGGFNFNYDQAGLSRLHLTTLGLNGSYTHKLSQTTFVTAGLLAGINQRGFKIGDLTFDRQYDPGRGQFDPSAANGENFTNMARFFLNFGTGLNLRIQSKNEYELVDELVKRSRLDVGLGLYHFNRPDQGFIKDAPNDELFMRFSPYVMGVLMLGQDVDLVGNFSAQFQGPYREMVGMLGARAYVNRTPGKQLALQLGIGYRFHEISDAIIPGIELSYNAWQAGFTYDVNLSPFNVATLRRGGPELSVRYIITRVPTLPFKVCPLI